MKEIGQELDKYKKKNLEQELKKAFLEAKKDDFFALLVNKIPLAEKQLYQYTSLIEECSYENKNCAQCKSILECKNTIKGHAYTPIMVNDKLEFAYQTCRYQKKIKKETDHLANVYYFKMPQNLKDAKMKEIYQDDENRFSTIKWLNNFIKKYPEEKKGLYLYGNFGCGKTYLIAAMFNELAKKNIQSAIIYWPEFLRDLKGSFNIDFNEKFSQIQNIEVLLIDDIGAESVTDWSRDEILGPILQHRMQNEMPTFFTSNFDFKALEEHFSYGKDKVSSLKARRIIERVRYLADEQKIIGKNFRN